MSTPATSMHLNTNTNLVLLAVHSTILPAEVKYLIQALARFLYDKLCTIAGKRSKG